MKIERLPSGNYRVRKYHNGISYTATFDYKPSQMEALRAITDLIENERVRRESFKYYCEKYIDSKRNVLSPSSIVTYERLIKAMSSDFLMTGIDDIKQIDVQMEINRYAENHSPKTVRSLHGFISSVLGLFRPDFILRTTLPQRIQKERYLPTQDDIKAILEASRGTEDSIAFQLGILGLRRSEICALDMTDLKDNQLHIHANMVWNKKWIRKESPKTDAGNRTIFLPDSLVNEIRKTGYFFKYSPNKLLEHLQKLQKALEIPPFRFHDLRYFYASYASTVMPEQDVMALGGWKSDYIFKNIYRNSMKDKRETSATAYLNDIFP